MEIVDFITSITAPSAAFCIIIGTIQCFFGYRVFKVILITVGGMIGAMIGAGLGYGADKDDIDALMGVILGGLIGGGLLITLFFVGVFLFGGLMAAALFAAIFSAMEIQFDTNLLTLPAIVGGILAVIFQKLVIIVTTALQGAWLLVLGISHFTSPPTAANSIQPFIGPPQDQEPDLVHWVEQQLSSQIDQPFAWQLFWVVLVVLGIGHQYRSAPKPQTRSLDDE